MSSQNPMPSWWIPSDGIERYIISSNIQRYLGNDATVRPGKGVNENVGVDGFWIKAYRNLTSSMIEDLRNDSTKYKQQEQRVANARAKRPHPGDHPQEWMPDAPIDSYGGPNPQMMNTSRTIRREGDSPRAQEHGGPHPRSSQSRLATTPMDIVRMETDNPPRPPIGFHPPTGPVFGQDGRPIYPSDARPYPPEMPPPQGQGYGPRPPVTSPPLYGGPPPPQEFLGNYPPHYDEGPHGGYPPRGEYYGQAADIRGPAPGRNDVPFGNHYNGPPPPRGPDRYGQPEFQEARYAYPSPATTVSSLNARDRDHAQGPPPQQTRYGQAAGPPPSYDRADNDSGYGQPPGAPYDQYGRPTASPDFSPSQPSAPGPARIGASIRRPSSITDTRDTQRRRI